MRVGRLTINDVLWANLRTCQQEGIDTVVKYLYRPISDKSCLLSLPTGAGKSGAICTLAHYSKHKKVLILCHRRAVCNQLAEQLSGAFFSKVAPAETIKQKAVYRDVKDTSKSGVYVTTFHMLRQMESTALEALKESIDLVLIDEGHAEPSPVWSQLARGLDAHKVIITATPYRNDLFQFDVDPASSYVYTFNKALRDRILEAPVFETENESNLVIVIGEFLKRYPDAKCIVKCDRFEQIQGYVSLLGKEYNVLAIHEQFKNSGQENRKTSVPSALAESEYQVLIHQRKLDEGVDIPQAKLLILTYPVASGRELVQTIGRVVRTYKGYESKVIEIATDTNSKMWENYLEFDQSISSAGDVKSFLNTLDTASLLETYLSAFPDVSYFGATFKRKFDLKAFDPQKSLVIPLASVCFIAKRDHFAMELLGDMFYWNSSKDGELVEKFDDIDGMTVLLSVCFRNSKFLRDELFLNPL